MYSGEWAWCKWSYKINYGFPKTGIFLIIYLYYFVFYIYLYFRCMHLYNQLFLSLLTIPISEDPSHFPHPKVCWTYFLYDKGSSNYLELKHTHISCLDAEHLYNWPLPSFSRTNWSLTSLVTRPRVWFAFFGLILFL